MKSIARAGTPQVGFNNTAHGVRASGPRRRQVLRCFEDRHYACNLEGRENGSGHERHVTWRSWSSVSVGSSQRLLFYFTFDRFPLTGSLSPDSRGQTQFNAHSLPRMGSALCVTGSVRFRSHSQAVSHDSRGPSECAVRVWHRPGCHLRQPHACEEAQGP